MKDNQPLTVNSLADTLQVFQHTEIRAFLGMHTAADRDAVVFELEGKEREALAKTIGGSAYHAALESTEVRQRVALLYELEKLKLYFNLTCEYPSAQQREAATQERQIDDEVARFQEELKDLGPGDFAI